MVAELISDNGTERARLRPFVFGDRWTWVAAPPVSDGFDIEGFEIEVRVSLSNADVKAFQESLVDIDSRLVDHGSRFFFDLDVLQAERKKLFDPENKLSPTERDKQIERNREAVTALRRQFNKDQRAIMVEKYEMVAPHIRDWNAYVPADNELGYEKVAPPIKGGAASLEAIDPNMANWAANRICDAWRLGKSITGTLRPSESTLELSQERKGGPKVVSE